MQPLKCHCSLHCIIPICYICYMHLLLLLHKPQPHMDLLFKDTSSVCVYPNRKNITWGSPRWMGWKFYDYTGWLFLECLCCFGYGCCLNSSLFCLQGGCLLYALLTLFVFSVCLSLAYMKSRGEGRAGVYIAPVGSGCTGKSDSRVASLGVCLHLTAAGRSEGRTVCGGGRMRNREMYTLHMLLLLGSKNTSSGSH